MQYSTNLAQWSLRPAAESLIAAYIVRLTKGKYSEDEHRVYHSKKISRMNQMKILGYFEAVNATNYGEP
jgi:hypothetical protein